MKKEIIALMVLAAAVAAGIAIMAEPGDAAGGCEHSYVETVISEPGCEGYGIVLDICEICGDTKSTITEPLGHDWGGWSIVSEPGKSDDTPGTVERVCETCGAKETKECVVATVTVSLPSGTSVFGVKSAILTLEVEGVCQAYDTPFIPGTGKWSKSGQVVSFKEELGRASITFMTATSLKDEVFRTDVLALTDGGAPAVAATLSVKGTTSGNVDTEVGLDVHGCIHSFKSKTLSKATCTEDGLKRLTCRNCGLVVESPVKAAGHVPTEPATVVDVAPTCTDPGSYETSIACSKCGQRFSAIVTPTAALGHDFDDTVITPATCTEDGEMHRDCARCGYSCN